MLVSAGHRLNRRKWSWCFRGRWGQGAAAGLWASTKEAENLPSLRTLLMGVIFLFSFIFTNLWKLAVLTVPCRLIKHHQKLDFGCGREVQLITGDAREKDILMKD